ncbi:MAG: chromosome segregation protein SMC [Robiginitomaculum sp.]|nr:MAG: chromosome segregation protein SMC [Robiginitomaculum sp.]
MQFTSLKIAGFKSFVDPSEFQIEVGVTGVVGPNGCGKSNLLEALRWVMGANSAKAMRAGAMDDVIFSGTGQRPARNHADVVLTIDNSDRSAPSQFNDSDVLEISRRINRGAGSSYHINGKSCRAKDVQLLFADASTGANSPALVRQGQINELIAAKPQNRRRVLEEAAGISGLHTRRHEAELRLRAAETNLSRLDDIGEEIESQYQQLKKQVRVASRYRNLATEIRALESFAALLRWTEAKAAMQSTQAELDELAQKSGELAGIAARALVAAELANDGMDELRREQAIAQALVARLSAARESVERDERDAKARRAALEHRLQEIARDLLHETNLSSDATQSIARLEVEKEGILALSNSDDQAQSEALAATARQAEQERDLTEARFEELSVAQAERQALIANAQNLLSTAKARCERFRTELGRAEEVTEALQADPQLLADTETSEQEKTAAAEIVIAQRTVISDHEQTLVKLDDEVQSHRRLFDDLRRERDELAAEMAGLQNAIAISATGDWAPISDDLKVQPGFERALAVALGDDLQASTDTAAPSHWDQARLPKQQLPAGADPLSKLVTAPKELQARLSQIGVVDEQTGNQLAGELLPGQRLVSGEGQLWRWDGLQISPDAPSAAALHLEQKNRLGALGPLREETIAKTEKARDIWLSAKQKRTEQAELLKTARKQMPDLEQLARQAEQTHQGLLHSDMQRKAQAEANIQKLEHWADELRVAQLELEAAEIASLNVPDETSQAYVQELETARQQRDQARTLSAEAEASFRAVQRENESRAARLVVIESDMQSWQKRAEGSNERFDALSTRETETKDRLQKALAAPDEIEQRRRQIFDECEIAEKRQSSASDALAEADSNLRETRDATRAAESAASDAREHKAALTARLESAAEKLAEITRSIQEALGCEPEELADSETGLRKIPSDAQEADTRLHKLRIERDNIGGVNLQAEEQAEELATRLDTMQADRDEITTAISKLRTGVDSLNHEGRERLLNAFETINNHFKSLFLTLFGGGEAELRLTESDDPLEAGLEIYACPPGKKMGTMSLMSGGEQALTAMALIFAVFLSNPAPVCVLDEVDAPLDDANVERFCAMLDEMRSRTQTRFIVITHNPLTMSRVDRLYGVTMAERGVSQLVSVDLQLAEGLIAAE